MGETDGHPSRSDLSGTTVGRFRFEERLGAGATGEVYRATDLQLGRLVAIKRLRPTLRADASPTHGLLPEARRASALNHPGIASVYDLFTEGGEQFLVMEYVDGPTLRERLTAPLDVMTFRSIATQCAEALDAAHERHILHGDVKPANIMLTRDRETVKLCDFGLARYLGHQGAGVSDSASTITPGLAGTPAYMAPEVAFELVPDERADVFSLGVVFYEMLAGVNPFAAGSVVGTLDRIRTFSPRPLDEIRPDVPLTIARLVGRMLEKDRDRRVTTAGEAARELARVPIASPAAPDPVEQRRGTWWRAVFVAGVVVAVVAAAFGVRRLSAPAAREPSAPRESMHLVVLPFAVSGAGDKVAFVDGLVDALVERLSRLTVGHGLQVASVGDLRARRVASVADAREQIGANVALTGALAYAGDVVRVTARLVNTKSGREVDARHFEGRASDPQALRDGIIGAAISLMGLTLDAEERRAFDQQDQARPGAYDYYLQARGYLLNYDRLESLQSAVSVFRRALEVDPRYAPAYAGLGQAYWRTYELTRVSTWVEPARASCEGALAIDARLSEAHACLGMVLSGTGEYERAVTEFARALELEPTNDILYLGLATAFERLQRPADAERTYQRAIALRPHYWAAYNTLALYYYRRGMYDDALQGFQQVVTLAPDSFRGYASLGATYFMKDQTAEAVAAFEKSMSIRPNYGAASNLGTLYFYEGEFERSATAYRQALSLEQGSYQVWSNLAAALEAAGHRSDAQAAHRRTIELAEEGLRVNPRNVALHMAIAEAQAGLGDLTRSRASLDQVLRAAPTDARTQFSLAVYFEYRLGDRSMALDWLAKAIASGQTWREIDRSPALRRLRTDTRFEELRRTG